MREAKSIRLEKQRERSKKNRDQRRAGLVPDRDDIARVALRWLLIRAAAIGDHRKRFKLEGHILDELVRLGFDARASEDVFEDLIEKYTKEAWDLFPRVHLRAQVSNMDGPDS